MKTKLLAGLLLAMATVGALGQPVAGPNPVTEFTLQFLRATNAADGRAILEIVGTNVNTVVYALWTNALWTNIGGFVHLEFPYTNRLLLYGTSAPGVVPFTIMDGGAYNAISLRSPNLDTGFDPASGLTNQSLAIGLWGNEDQGGTFFTATTASNLTGSSVPAFAVDALIQTDGATNTVGFLLNSAQAGGDVIDGNYVLTVENNRKKLVTIQPAGDVGIKGTLAVTNIYQGPAVTGLGVNSAGTLTTNDASGGGGSATTNDVINATNTLAGTLAPAGLWDFYQSFTAHTNQIPWNQIGYYVVVENATWAATNYLVVTNGELALINNTNTKLAYCIRTNELPITRAEARFVYHSFDNISAAYTAPFVLAVSTAESMTDGNGIINAGGYFLHLVFHSGGFNVSFWTNGVGTTYSNELAIGRPGSITYQKLSPPWSLVPGAEYRAGFKRVSQNTIEVYNGPDSLLWTLDGFTNLWKSATNIWIEFSGGDRDVNGSIALMPGVKSFSYGSTVDDTISGYVSKVNPTDGSASNSWVGSFGGSGSGLTNLNASALASGTVPNTVLGNIAGALTNNEARAVTFTNDFTVQNGGATGARINLYTNGSVMVSNGIGSVITSNNWLYVTPTNIANEKTYVALHAPQWGSSGNVLQYLSNNVSRFSVDTAGNVSVDGILYGTNGAVFKAAVLSTSSSTNNPAYNEFPVWAHVRSNLTAERYWYPSISTISGVSNSLPLNISGVFTITETNTTNTCFEIRPTVAALTNLFIGPLSGGTSNTTGNGLTFIGWFAGHSNRTGVKNVGIGNATLKNNLAGTDNTAVGFGTMTGVTTSQNTSLGSGALSTTGGGGGNIAIGFMSLSSLTGGDGGNVSIGTSAAGNHTSGANNIFVGGASGQGPGGSAGGSNNAALGYRTLYALTEGYDNAVVGLKAGQAINAGYSNSALGSYALGGLTSGFGNVGVGAQAGGEIAAGRWNTAVGAYVRGANTSSNIWFGSGGACKAQYSTNGYGWGFAETLTVTNGMLWTTNSMTASYQITAGKYQAFATNASFTLGALTGVIEDGMAQEAVLIITNTLGSNITVTTPANWDGGGTFTITNKAVISLVRYPNYGTNVVFNCLK